MPELLKVICPNPACRKKIFKHERFGYPDHYLQTSGNKLCPESKSVKEKAAAEARKRVST